MKLRLEIPKAMIEVLQACLGATSADCRLDCGADRRVVTTAASPPVVRAEYGGARSASIRNNLGVALYDSGMRKQEQGQKDAAVRCFEAAHEQLSGPSRSSPRTPAPEQPRRRKVGAGRGGRCQARFDDALKVDPDHKEATFNAGVAQGHRDGARRRSTAPGCRRVEDGRGKVELASAVSFGQGSR